MMGWQDAVVYLLLIYCVWRIVSRIRIFFAGTAKKNNPCESCASGCKLKDLYEQQRKTCSEKQKKMKKSCCK